MFVFVLDIRSSFLIRLAEVTLGCDSDCDLDLEANSLNAKNNDPLPRLLPSSIPMPMPMPYPNPIDSSEIEMDESPMNGLSGFRNGLSGLGSNDGLGLGRGF
jgi:hypothetical protein